MTTEPLSFAEDERTSAEQLEDFALGDDYQLNPRFVEMVVDAAEADDVPNLSRLMDALRPADIADLIGFVPAERRDAIVRVLSPEVFTEVLPELDEQIREELLETFTPARLAQAVSTLDSDDVAAIVEDMDEERRDAVLAAMPAFERAAVETSLAYPEDTAGRLMQREVVAAPEFWTVGHTIDHLRATREDLPELFFDIYVVDPAFKPVGAVAVSGLLRRPRDCTLHEILEEVTEFRVDQDQEEVAYAFEKYRLISAPVVDDAGRLVGQITVDDIVGVLQEENQEDILALAGVGDEGRDANTYGSIRARLPWLSVNLLAAGLAGALVPLTLSRLRQDPAVSSGVFVTAVTDIFGFFVFLGLASLILL